MNKLHPKLTDMEYWTLRFKLLEIQKQLSSRDLYAEQERDILDDLHSYLVLQEEETDPWN
jgi:hypothetical protein